MERLAKYCAAALTAVLLSGCFETLPTAPPPMVVPPKPAIDARLTSLCDVTLTPVADDALPEDLFVSYGEAVTKLNKCACRQRAARNVLCSLSSPGCTEVPLCKEPSNDSPTQ